ncbi:MAG TPA: PilN domain-containing protein [Candidatus Saccharibacteria bacterium]|nr:PilN domain-containing protein [Candidatus Saccharibacteria bacterium]
MIQLNLLPDIKAKYIKAQRNKRTIILSSVIISGVSLGLVILMSSYVYIGQKIRLNMLENNIKANSTKLKNVEGLNKILTIQNQLNRLTELHKQKPVSERLFAYLSQIVPNDVQISSLEVDYKESKMKFTGTAKTLEATNKLVDTLKFTEYMTDQTQDSQRAFSEVVLSSFSVGKDTTAGVNYTIDLKFDPVIFSSDNKTVTLIVPKITSTRSQTEQPDVLFKAQPVERSDR